MRLTVTRYRAYCLSTGDVFGVAVDVVGVVDVVGGGVIELVGGGFGTVVWAAVCAYAGTPMAMPSAIARTNFN